MEEARSFNVSVRGHEYTYDTNSLKNTLTALGSLESKQVSWVHADLTLGDSSQVGRTLFCLINLIARYVSRDAAVFLKEYFFQVNLETSQAILNALKGSISGDGELEKLFTQATTQFNTIALNHQVLIPDFKGKENEKPKPSPNSFEGLKPARV